MRKKILFPLIGALSVLSTAAYAAPADTEQVSIIFTHDIHDYYYPTSMIGSDGVINHGGAARLATLIRENSSESSIYVDAGDFSMGTLLQAGYSDNATELRLLGRLGCEVTTFGNHEFDYGAKGVSDMLKSALASGDTLPDIVCANVDFGSSLTDDQYLFKKATDEYGMSDYVIKDVNGVKIAFIGLMGNESISDAPTSGQEWADYIDSAKTAVKDIGGNADVIVALSHSGTNGDGKTGEDFELAKAVPEIDVIISGHSHTTYEEPILVGDTVLVSQGCYLENVGKLTLGFKNGEPYCESYELLKLDDTVTEDEEIKKYVDQCISEIDDSYVSKFGYSFNQVLAYNPTAFESLNHMYETHREYPMGDLIADAYMYSASENGINDIDVALVGLGTIRGTFKKGDITTADVFETCSLGVGADGSAGHPLLSAYITGKELKLLVELDASLGPMVSSIKMSYSGLKYTFNDKRLILNRVTELKLVRPDGSTEKIDDNKLYRVAVNTYAANMLGMLNGLTKGILKITPKDKDGNVITDFYDFALKNTSGEDIKEWVAVADYISSFEKNTDGKPELPSVYSAEQGRKVHESVGGLAAIKNPGKLTVTVMVLPILIVVLIVFIIRRHRKKKRQKANS